MFTEFISKEASPVNRKITGTYLTSFKDITLLSELKGFEDIKRMVKPEALCLPIADLLNNPLASKIVSAIQGINVVSMTAGKLQPIQS